MTRDEFCGLPAAVALGLLWDKSAGIRDAMSKVDAPPRPRPPKYDQAIYRKGGVSWASEHDLSGLEYWCRKYTESAEHGGEYAEKDAKKAKQVAFWIAWRRCDPTARWSGERNHEQVTADAPSSKPFVFEREPRREDMTSAGVAAPGDTYEEPFGEDSSQIPF